MKPMLIPSSFRPFVVFLLGALAASSAPAEEMTPSSKQLDAWMTPLWKSDVVTDESLMFWTGDDGRTEAPLLFEPLEILSVRDASLKTAFEKDRDWSLDGRIVSLPEHSRIPRLTVAKLYPLHPDSSITTFARSGGGFIQYRTGAGFHQDQVSVTYRHSAGSWDGPRPHFDETILPNTLEKLRAGGPLKVVVYGDSISGGANSSGMAGIAPFQPAWAGLLALWLQQKYQAEVTLVNKSEGGKDSQWGNANAGTALLREKADLIIIAFGMNDRSKIAPAEFQTNIERIIDVGRRANPDVEFILVSSTLNNPAWNPPGHLDGYAEVLRSLAGPGLGFVDMLAIHRYLLVHKRYEDMTGNNVNHPNDFLHRIYAHSIATLLGGD